MLAARHGTSALHPGWLAGGRALQPLLCSTDARAVPCRGIEEVGVGLGFPPARPLRPPPSTPPIISAHQTQPPPLALPCPLPSVRPPPIAASQQQPAEQDAPGAPWTWLLDLPRLPVSPTRPTRLRFCRCRHSVPRPQDVMLGWVSLPNT
uniref:Uncharacterized protein n=1 Tax=Setaria italica TaxID=4555 RepID=K3YWF9_SETIT